jgi:hypothetical protein
MNLNWVVDAFFVAREVANEISRVGITGVSFGPAAVGRDAGELGDRVQMLIPTIVACADTSKLPPVTCRSNNEEAVAIRAMLEKRRKERPAVLPTPRSLALRENLQRLREKMAAIPFCGRVNTTRLHPSRSSTDRLTTPRTCSRRPNGSASVPVRSGSPWSRIVSRT